ncbi:N-acetylaspartate synthetase [Mortierella sp. GBA30]|nr:N-acetylaspartate synthetase [Mortierella sp. GBA30]
MVAIDKSAIRIRPYAEGDHDQVIDMILTGLNTVGDRIFHRILKHKSTAISILTKSIIYTLLLEIAIVTYSNSSSSLFTLEDLRVLQETLMRPESAQDLILRFLKPSFLLLWTIVSLIVASTTILGLYRHSIRDNQKYIQSCFEDDLQDIAGYYQSSSLNGKKNHSQFWVACLDSHPQVILGCIALDHNYVHLTQLKKKHMAQGGTVETFIPPKESDAELRRLSVHQDYRRLGIGKILINALTAHAVEKGFKRVILTTTMVQKEAIRGYIGCGFEKENLIRLDKYFSLWFGVLNLKATEKDKEERRSKQQDWLREVEAY